MNSKPLAIDLLVIKKNASAQIANEIGAFFRGHNTIEYKSPEDSLDMDVFYKLMAYAGLCKSYGKTLDERGADSITVSIIREAVSKELFQYFKEHRHSLINQGNGNYYVEGRVLFPTQVIVTRELN